jgi:cytoplasmic iron level regulating protein YaaA (DUF328/UPF0246 family)
LFRYKKFSGAFEKQAMFMYSGPAFQGMNPTKFDESQIEYAQNHVRILSGLYGLLKPCDAIKPYRIDMG